MKDCLKRGVIGTDSVLTVPVMRTLTLWMTVTIHERPQMSPILANA